MNWADERYVRLYTRDTNDLIAIGWEGRFTFYELLRKVDRSGVLDTGGDLDVTADLLRVPADVFRTALPRLEQRGMVHLTDRAIVIPRFLDAQEARASGRLRARAFRERRRDASITQCAAEQRCVTATSRTVTEPSREITGVTPSRTVPSRAVPSCAVPSRTVPSLPAAAGPVGVNAKQKKQQAERPALPFTVDQLMESLHSGSGGRVITSGCTRELAMAITERVRDLLTMAPVPTLDDVRLAGAFIGARWQEGITVGPAWAATKGKLANAISKGREWDAAGRPVPEVGGQRDVRVGHVRAEDHTDYGTGEEF